MPDESFSRGVIHLTLWRVRGEMYRLDGKILPDKNLMILRGELIFASQLLGKEAQSMGSILTEAEASYYRDPT